MKKIIVIAGLIGSIVGGAAHAAEARLSDAQIAATLISGEVDAEGNTNFGGCMARLNKVIATETALDCPGAWVTFSCSGDFMSVANASRLLNSAQMADALNLTVSLRIDDSKKHNGYCLAERLQFN